MPEAPLPKTQSASRRWLAALELSARLEREPGRLLADVVEEWAAKQPQAAALIAAGTSWTYAELAAQVNRVARWAMAQGVGKGARVALMLGPSVDYPALWCGLTLAGCVVALINTQLKDGALAHVLAEADAQHVIVGTEFSEAVVRSLALRNLSPRVWPWGEFQQAVAAYHRRPLAATERPPVSLEDTALLIYTSGTTGLPKAARISHARVMGWGHWFAGLMAATPQDRLYNCLPLFHSVGGVAAIASMLVGGGSVVIAEKFSASRFWPEVVAQRCTIFQYIGELCRYLAAAPVQDAEKRHHLRLAVGNGLSGGIWEKFQSRFAIPDILEFYAATEGSFSLFNMEGKPGALGRIPSYLAHRFPAAIVSFDATREMPLRGADGLCVKVATGEAGEALGRISGAGAGRFEGYTSGADSEKKILRDVLEQGDAWFRTGDLMRQDAQGFWYFVDRIGDTFRWKGENVSTTEVAAAISTFPGVKEATVYGVTVPGHDGRAGMAAIAADEAPDWAALYAHLAAALPAYARPVFIRLLDGLTVTATFKPQKHVLLKRGFGGDGVMVIDATAQSYVALSNDKRAALASGRARI